MNECTDNMSAHALAEEARTDSATQPKIVYMYLEDNAWVQRGRPLPPPPVCFLCGKESLWLTRLGYDSIYDEEWVCPSCQDEAIGLLKAHRQWMEAGQPRLSKTTKSYQLVESDGEKWDKALAQELEEHAEAYERLSNM